MVSLVMKMMMMMMMIMMMMMMMMMISLIHSFMDWYLRFEYPIFFHSQVISNFHLLKPTIFDTPNSFISGLGFSRSQKPSSVLGDPHWWKPLYHCYIYYYSSSSSLSTSINHHEYIWIPSSKPHRFHIFPLISSPVHIKHHLNYINGIWKFPQKKMVSFRGCLVWMGGWD